MSDVPEELVPDPEGSLMGGGLCFTPFPNMDVWTNEETPSPCRAYKHEPHEHEGNVGLFQMTSLLAAASL